MIVHWSPFSLKALDLIKLELRIKKIVSNDMVESRL